METHKHSLCHEQPTVTASSDQGSCDLVQQSRSLARDTFSTHISLRKRKAVPSQKASYQYGTLVAAAAKIGVLSLPWAMDHDPWSPELPNGWQIKAAKPRMMSVSKKIGSLATTELGSFQWEAPQLEDGSAAPKGHKAGVTWLTFIYLVDSDSLEGSYTQQGDLFLRYPLPPHVWHDLILNDIPLGRRPKGRLRDVHPEDEDEGVSDKQLATSMSVFMDTQRPCFADHWSYASSTTMILDGYNYNIIYRFDTILDLQG